MFGVYDLAAPVAEVGVAEIVRHDEDDVRPILRSRGTREKQGRHRERGHRSGKQTLHLASFLCRDAPGGSPFARPQKDRVSVAQTTSL